MRITLTVISSLLVLASCNKGKNNPESCNGESTRRSVKICTDDLSSQIDLTPEVISVYEIGQLSVPEIEKEDPRQDAEMKTYTITAKVHKVSKHRDGDWKIKLTDDEDHYVNCESPNMGCPFIDSSLFYNEMSDVRYWIESNVEDLEGKTVTITGVGFIDIDHKYPRNAAENEMELHPILNIQF